MIGEQNQVWYKIGQVARELGIAVETIRMYEREALFIAAKTETGQRLYNQDDVHWLNCIRRLITEKGLNIEGIRRLLALLPCWEMRPCTEQERQSCPAYQNAVRPCWAIKSQLSSSCITDNCRDCNVYRSAAKCTNLKSLLYQMQPGNSSS